MCMSLFLAEFINWFHKYGTKIALIKLVFLLRGRLEFEVLDVEFQLKFQGFYHYHFPSLLI